MPLDESYLLGLALLGLSSGSWSVYLMRMSQEQIRVIWGKRLYLLTLLLLGLITMVAALRHAYALTPLGLSIGFLVVAAVFEVPTPQPPVREVTENL